MFVSDLRQVPKTLAIKNKESCDNIKIKQFIIIIIIL